MFNIVKRRDFMLGQNVSELEAEKARDDYGRDYVVVRTSDDHGLSNSTPTLIPLMEPEVAEVTVLRE